MMQTMAAVVVGAAIVEVVGGVARVLAGERSAPPELAGRWEFPGGKVEAGESDVQALVRECREELGVDIVVGAQLGGDLAIPGGRVLRVYAARVGVGPPTVTEHRSVRWLSAGELDSVPWLDTNRPLLEPLAALLRISLVLTPHDDENSR
ncbi:MAG: 8-oxo-dGTP diphosphatase [Frankiales bacterium]|jgi:8-oxo-dGTP diphosphatase|nr:8-oxo-dGTP diphosphatase [Frankiales bacterium]